MLAKMMSGEIKPPVAADALDSSLLKVLDERAKIMTFLQEHAQDELQTAFQRLHSECVAADC